MCVGKKYMYIERYNIVLSTAFFSHLLLLLLLWFSTVINISWVEPQAYSWSQSVEMTWIKSSPKETMERQRHTHSAKQIEKIIMNNHRTVITLLLRALHLSAYYVHFTHLQPNNIWECTVCAHCTMAVAVWYSIFQWMMNQLIMINSEFWKNVCKRCEVIVEKERVEPIVSLFHLNFTVFPMPRKWFHEKCIRLFSLQEMVHFISSAQVCFYILFFRALVVI